MPNRGDPWTEQDIKALKEAYKKREVFESDNAWAVRYGRGIGRSTESVRSQARKLILMDKMGKGRVPTSNYPVYDKPLEMEGDAIVLGDLEFPYHHAEFLNRCLHLAETWGIKQAILAGDVLHFDSLSSFNPNWKKPASNGLTETAERKLMDIAATLPKNKQQAMIDAIVELGQAEESDGVSSELDIARRALKALAVQFDRIDYVIGNHDSRLLNTLQTALDPEELLRLLTTDRRWRIAPFYYSILHSGGNTFQIEHPRNTAKYSAWKLVAKFGCSIIMAHNHHLNFTFDLSGRYYAIECGVCCDESRMPYVAQRHNISPQHILGAVIVRNGYPHLLHKYTQWSEMEKMK
uniref:Calcineurin-like phosphoesterase domain-containing protein n=1 Tax=viral metagenome TaxID=1070528 RepID=A0A6H1ZB55_9ZZZZ